MKQAVILNDTSFESHHGCEVVVENIKRLLFKNGIETISTNSVGVDWEQNKVFIRKLCESDIVVVNGEGTIHHSQPRALELSSITRYVKRHLNIPVVLINSTIQDNDDEIIENLRRKPKIQKLLLPSLLSTVVTNWVDLRLAFAFRN